MKRNGLSLMLILAMAFCTIKVKARDYNIVKFGAVGNGLVMNTISIQKAIDKCAEDGGGRVIIPAGNFLPEVCI